MSYLEIEKVIGREIIAPAATPPSRQRYGWPAARLAAALPQRCVHR